MPQISPPSGQENISNQPRPLMLVVTHRNPNPVLGALPKYSYVYNVRMEVIEAFDGGITLKVGNETDDDAYCTATAVASLGIKSPSAGAGVGYDDTSRTVKALVVGTATQGKAIVIVEWFYVPRVN